MERYPLDDYEEETDINNMSTSDLLASLGMSSKSVRGSRANLGLMSPSAGMAVRSQMKDPEISVSYWMRFVSKLMLTT
jgi:hypothetical protein